MDKQKKKEINESIVGVKNRDEEALNTLYFLVAHSIKYIALKFLKNEEDAQDLEQDFWASIYDIADKFTYLKNGFSYLCKVMSRMAINRYKKLNVEKQHTVEFVDYGRIEPFDENEVIIDLDKRMAVQKAMETLSPKEQAIMQMAIFEDKTIVQTAKELGLSKSDVGRIRLEARNKLKIKISEYLSWEKGKN